VAKRGKSYEYKNYFRKHDCSPREDPIMRILVFGSFAICSMPTHPETFRLDPGGGDRSA
jgi:hypothetical protein